MRKMCIFAAKNMEMRFIILSLLLSVTIHLQAAMPGDADDLSSWNVGAVVSDQAVNNYGLSRCFVAMPIPDSVWQRMQGKTYKTNPYIGRSNLCYLRLLHRDGNQQTRLGEMVCNKRIANTLVRIFRQLYEAHYPIERMVLPDDYDADDERQMRDNNSSCFCYRVVAGSKVLSAHARGLAVDINTLYNPYVKHRADGTVYVQPATATPYVDRSRDFKYKIDTNDLCYKLFTQAGFVWGGSWKRVKDYQHFELRTR